MNNIKFSIPTTEIGRWLYQFGLHLLFKNIYIFRRTYFGVNFKAIPAFNSSRCKKRIF